MDLSSTPELIYVGLIFGLFVIPRMLTRFRLPAGVSAIFLGIAAGAWFLNLDKDVTLQMMSLFGITALFLFAGLDVDLEQLKKSWVILLQHVIISVLLLALVIYGLMHWWLLSFQIAGLVALALLTPSCGFILDSLDSFGLSDEDKFWVKSKAIATEIVALVFMFIDLQSESPKTLAISLVGMAVMVLVVPLLFRFFVATIAPYAQGSEFAFLLMTAILCAIITRKLGAYYLVGAFFVGTAARQFKKMLPPETEAKTMGAMQLFAGFFIPVYFFKAGMEIKLSDLSTTALTYACLWFIGVVPAKIFFTALHRRIILKQPLIEGAKVGSSLMPTLVFGLVIAGLLREKFQINPNIFGGVIIYTILVTMLPGLVLTAKKITVRVFTDELPPIPTDRT
jgi:Kef-type K+ transport system membrane component KefB